VYWQWDKPFSESGGVHSIFPLWVYQKQGQRQVLHLVWPLARFERRQNLSRNRVFPLFSHGNLPNGDKWFHSILYGHAFDSRTGGNRQWLMPLFVRGESGDEQSFWSVPYSRRVSDDLSATYIMAGMWGHTQKDDTRAHWLVPLYLFRESPERSLWLTPLGGGTRRADGSSSVYTLPYTRIREASGRDLTIIPPLLSWRDRHPERDDWHILGPLSRFSTGESPVSTYVFPLYYHNPETRLLLTPLYQRGAYTAAEVRWNAVLPFFYQRHGPERSAWITPLGALTRGPGGTGRTLTPFYARVEDSPGHVLHAIPPLLSWRTVQKSGANDTRLLLGLGGRSVSAQGDTTRAHLFPLLYHEPAAKTLLTPAYATWQHVQKTVRVVPPLLSWSVEDTETETRHLRIAAGLYGQSTRGADGERLASHLLPFWMYEKGSRLFTPLYGRDAEKDGSYRYWLTPLLGTYRNEKSGAWLWPLFFWRRDTETGHHNSSFLVWGRHHTSEGRRSTRFFPVFTYKSTEREQPYHPDQGYTAEEDALSLFLLYGEERIVTRFPPHAGQRVGDGVYHSLTRESNHLFPLWSFKTETFDEGAGPSLSEGSVLWKLYDSRVERGTEASPHEYVRRRILWRAWHYERLNGDVSVDSLPFITYDRKSDGFKRVSFLWRFFRYETHPEHGKKLDLHFLPIRR